MSFFSCHSYDCLFPYQVNASLKSKALKKKSEKTPSEKSSTKKTPKSKNSYNKKRANIGLSIEHLCEQIAHSNKEAEKSEMRNAGGGW